MRHFVRYKNLGKEGVEDLNEGQLHSGRNVPEIRQSSDWRDLEGMEIGSLLTSCYYHDATPMPSSKDQDARRERCFTKEI